MNEEQKSVSTHQQEIIKNGLWKNNPALVQLLGLCPLFAVSSSVVSALGLGLATLFVLTLSNFFASLIRNQLSPGIRLTAFLIIIASLTACVELIIKAYTYELYQMLGIFVPLIVTNYAILQRAEIFANKNKIIPATLDGFTMGIGFLLALLCVGIIREALGAGHIFGNMQLLFGPIADNWEINLLSDNASGMILVLLPPGAFIIVGLLIAIKNLIDLKFPKRQLDEAPPIMKGSKRVRTTGEVA